MGWSKTQNECLLAGAALCAIAVAATTAHWTWQDGLVGVLGVILLAIGWR